MTEGTKQSAAVLTWVGNPFLASEESREEAGRILSRVELRAELRRQAPPAAEALLLAVCHHQLWETPGEPPEALGEWSKALPRPREDYLRVSMAASRCAQALRALRGGSSAMAHLRRQVWSACFGQTLVSGLSLERVIRDHDLLLIGETGTGKEDVARAIQEGALGPSDGSRAPRSNVNAAAIPDTLLESELFGHLKGSFTGATESRSGRIRAAHRDTFFLDEVGDLPEAVQVKLLRVLEADEVQPIGSDHVQQVDVRFVAASHKDLAQMIAVGNFRQDLYQRLAGNVIQLSPLRDRREDLAEIARDFVRRCVGSADPEPLAKVERWLASPAVRGYRWPGNVRELQNVIRSVLLGLEPRLQRVDGAAHDDAHEDALPAALRGCTATEEDVAAWYLRRVLRHTNGNLAAAARLLGVDRSTVQRRARRLLPR